MGRREAMKPDLYPIKADCPSRIPHGFRLDLQEC
jgi:hypothetical protein